MCDFENSRFAGTDWMRFKKESLSSGASSMKVFRMQKQAGNSMTIPVICVKEHTRIQIQCSYAKRERTSISINMNRVLIEINTHTKFEPEHK